MRGRGCVDVINEGHETASACCERGRHSWACSRQSHVHDNEQPARKRWQGKASTNSAGIRKVMYLRGGGNIPDFCITCRNLMTTFEQGRTSTWRLPRFSALEMLFKVSAKTLMRTIFQSCEGETCEGIDGRCAWRGDGAAPKLTVGTVRFATRPERCEPP